jgi:hypothetical protein
MLTLDPSTLFYWNLSNPPAKKLKHSVQSWANSIPVNAKPPSRAPSHANTVTTTKSGTSRINAVPSLTYASSRSTGRSVLTNSIAVTHTGPPPVRIKPDPDYITIHDGGLSDHDEIRGRERDAAVVSPPKGKIRLNSEASISSQIQNLSI